MQMPFCRGIFNNQKLLIFIDRLDMSDSLPFPGKEDAMRKQAMWVSVILGLTYLTANASFASVIAYDGFAYPVGPLAGQGPGTGFAGPWMADGGVMVSSPGLSSPLDLPSTGNAVGGFFNYFAPLSATLTQGFWASFLLFHSGPNDQSYMGLTSTGLPPTAPPRVAFGVRLGQYGIFDGASNFIPSPVPFTPNGSTDFLLANLQPVGAVWQVSLYVNPTSLAVPSLIFTVPLTAFNEVLNQNQAEFESDEVRLGTTAFDAGFVPEPASLGIVAIGFLLVMRRRQR